MLYDEQQILQIEEKLEKDIKRHKQMTIALTVFVVFFAISILYKPVCLWIKFHTPHVSSYDFVQISIDNEPIQKMYSDELSQSKTFEYKSLKNNVTARIIPVAYYKISGLTVAYNTYFPDRRGFDNVALYDIGLAWGKFGKGDFIRTHCNSSSEEYFAGARALDINCSANDLTLKEAGLSWTEIEKLYSHTHIIPANSNIMSALNTIKKYNIVELEGELVNVDFDGGPAEILSSLSRYDNNNNSVGGGACEIMYVTKVRIGNKVYL